MLIASFYEETQSAWGQELLESFTDYASRFWLIKPKAANLRNLLENTRAGRNNYLKGNVMSAAKKTFQFLQLGRYEPDKNQCESGRPQFVEVYEPFRG